MKAVCSRKAKLARCIERDGNSCVYCSCPNPDSIDHVVPIRAGGADTLDNLVAACFKCNANKGGSLLVQWLYRDSLVEQLICHITNDLPGPDLLRFKRILGPSLFARILRDWAINTEPFFDGSLELEIEASRKDD